MKSGIITSFLFLLCVALLAGCQTHVRVTTEPKGLVAYYNDQRIGKTPVEFTATNLIWEEHYIKFKRDRKTLRTVTLRKEVKVGPLIGGFCVGLPVLWAYGPRSNHDYDLTDEVKDLKGDDVSRSSDPRAIIENRTPPGMRFRIDGRDVTNERIAVAPGEHTVQLCRGEKCKLVDKKVFERNRLYSYQNLFQ